MKIEIQKLTDEQLTMLKIPSKPVEGNGWSVWDCEPSKFNWHYESKEIAYLYKGRVKVRTNDQLVEIKAGDFVIFPDGLSCTWDVIERVEKVYKFE